MRTFWQAALREEAAEPLSAATGVGRLELTEPANSQKKVGERGLKTCWQGAEDIANPPTIMTQLRARRLCQSAVWWTSLPQKRPLRRDKPCPRTELLQPISTLHGKLHWRARRASQKPAGETPCIGSEKVSKAAMPDACRATHFCSPRQNAKLGNELILEG